jgi:V/A-type H+-transporting ATPase subunit D
MGKLKLTINEQKRQKDALKRFQRYLPTLVLKKQYLQIERDRARRELEEKTRKEQSLLEEMHRWIAVLGEDVGLAGLLRVEEVKIEDGNVAGVNIPIFRGVRFKEIRYDLWSMPLWLDRAVEEIHRILTLRAEIIVLRKQLSQLEEELRVTTQRVNLFEKILIPKAIENIRIIQIFLSDQQTAAVVRGKIAKAKILGETA